MNCIGRLARKTTGFGACGIAIKIGIKSKNFGVKIGTIADFFLIVILLLLSVAPIDFSNLLPKRRP